MRSGLTFGFAFVLCSIVAIAGEMAKAATPLVSTPPALSASSLISDDATTYTISMTISDADGWSDIGDARILFNYTQSGNDAAHARGYIVWGVNDTIITRYGDTWSLSDATGGGRFGANTSNWGGSTYLTLLSCSTTTTGNASGGSGTRTVTWTFRVKPTWALNPVMNDADYWSANLASASSGWHDHPDWFDVLPASCPATAPTPVAPVVSNPSYGGFQVAINSADPVNARYAILVSPGVEENLFVQTSGAIGPREVWRTASEWATTTVSGVLSSTPYQVSVRSLGAVAGTCPSAWGPSTGVTTTSMTVGINAAATGTPINRGLLGHANRCDVYTNAVAAYNKMLDIATNTFLRGLAGGLDADTYNWKDLSGQGVGHTGSPTPAEITTLDYLRAARDHSATPLMTVNVRGTGPLASSGYCRFQYDNLDVSHLATLAADWVRYMNKVLPVYRQGDALPGDVQTLLDSISWYGELKLLAPGEPATPVVQWFEIGNEPDLALPWCTPGATTFSPSPADYANRYKVIAAAMKAVDPTIKIGPCITTANPGNAWLDAVLADPACPVDFISYHPYGPLEYFARTYGDTIASAQAGLRYIKTLQTERYNQILARINASNRILANISLISGEYNPSDWVWESQPQIRRQAHALGIVETLMTYAEKKLTGAIYWSMPAWNDDGTETPGYKTFELLQQELGTHLVSSITDNLNFRLYTTRNAGTDDVCLWGLNFSDTVDRSVRLQLSGLQVVEQVVARRLAKIGGVTSLFDRNDPPASSPPLIDVTDRVLSIENPSDFTYSFERGAITALILRQRPAANADFDRDGDVDGSDFGFMQRCFSGFATPYAPGCAPADLNGDNAVDSADVVRFLPCLMGSHVPVAAPCG